MTNTKVYTFFGLWFLSGIVMLLQIFPLDMTVADRWFYFPLIGLLGMLGVGLYTLMLSLNTLATKRIIIAVFFGAVLILVFSIRTIMRNADFHDPITLFAQDAQTENSSLLEDYAAREYMHAGNMQAAFSHLQKAVGNFPNAYTLSDMGDFYISESNLPKAQEYYSKALTLFETYYTTADSESRQRASDLFIYKKLTGALLLSNEDGAAEDLSKKGLQYYPDSSDLWIYLAISANKLHNREQAIAAAAKAKTLLPGDFTNLLYLSTRAGIDPTFRRRVDGKKNF